MGPDQGRAASAGPPDEAALAARQRLAPLLAGISDPFLHAVARLAMAWTLPIAGDFDGALGEAPVELAILAQPLQARPKRALIAADRRERFLSRR